MCNYSEFLKEEQKEKDKLEVLEQLEIRASDRIRTFPAPVAVRCYFRCVL